MKRIFSNLEGMMNISVKEVNVEEINSLLMFRSEPKYQITV